MNKVILLGNLTRDPETKYTTGENALAVTRFSIAVQRDYKKEGQPEADFINCIAFGKTGENIDKFFTKGRKIAVSGKLQVSTWEDNNGQKRYSTDVIVDSFDFCDKKSEGGSAPTTKPTENQGGYSAPAENIDEEDLPF